jgi:hypothetical protein
MWQKPMTMTAAFETTEVHPYSSPELSFVVYRKVTEGMDPQWYLSCQTLGFVRSLTGKSEFAVKTEALELVSAHVRRVLSGLKAAVDAPATGWMLELSQGGATLSLTERQRYEKWYRPDSTKACQKCGVSPIVPLTSRCGPCTFGEALPANGWYVPQEQNNGG